MTFRQLNQSYLIPAMQTVMIFGIVALCQPWNFFLHRYGVTIILVGLICFLITSHIGPGSIGTEEDVEDDVFDVSDHHDGKARART